MGSIYTLRSGPAKPAEPTKLVVLTFTITGCKNCPLYDGSGGYPVCRTIAESYKTWDERGATLDRACTATHTNWDALTPSCPFYSEQAANVTINNGS